MAHDALTQGIEAVFAVHAVHSLFLGAQVGEVMRRVKCVVQAFLVQTC